MCTYWTHTHTHVCSYKLNFLFVHTSFQSLTLDFGRFKAKSKCCNTSEKGNTNDCIHEGAPVKSQPPLIAKWRNGVKLQLPGRFEGDGKDNNVSLTISYLTILTSLISQALKMQI